MTLSLDAAVTLLNGWPPEAVASIEILFCLLAMAGLFRRYGVAGLYSFITILLIVANIQVLKGGQFIFPSHPIALGTMLFGIIALSFDIITEYYGKAAALKGVRLSFFMLASFTVLMFLTVGLRPLSPELLSADSLSLYTNHEHIKALFVPLPGILLASLIAYITSQYVDVMLFYLIRNISHKRLLWLRTVISTSVSAFIDTTLFSYLAWKLFSPTPVTWATLFTIYILGTYPLRLLCSFCFSPLIYLARYCLPPDYHEHATVSKE
jgi:uncharacterized integral membrane protein (TIGR00697 family)